jgi:hypothetical protein
LIELPLSSPFFRHDRVRESLLSSAVAEMTSARTLDGSILADPFFDEVIGGALAGQTSDAASIEAAGDANPLALFYALRRLGKPSRVLTPAATRDVVVVIHDWCSVVRWNNVGDLGAEVNRSMELFQRSQRHG